MVKIKIKKSDINMPDDDSGEEMETKERRSSKSKSGSPDGSYSCSSCQYTADSLSELRKHEEGLHHNGDSRLRCSECDFSCKRKEVFKKHMESHQKSERKGKSNSASKSASPDRVIKEETGRLYTCEICFKAFHSNFVLRTHLKAHKKLEKNGTCDKYYMFYLYSTS